MILFALWFTLLAPAGELRSMSSVLANASIELDENRDGLPDYWTPAAWQSRAKLTWDRQVARSGKASLCIADPGRRKGADWKFNSGRWISPPRPIQPGTSYRLEAWVKTENLTGNAQVVISWRKSGRYLSQVATATVSGTTDWKRLTVEATAPPEADELVVMFSVGYGMGRAWCDDIRLSGKSTPLPKIVYRFNDTRNWFPFEFPLDDTNRDSIDLSHFLHPPAGRFGFVQARPDGHLYFENGRRARFIGINLGSKSALPDKPMARIMAARFAKYGFNLIRLHSLDSKYAGLIDYARGTSQHFSSEALDRLDFFIAELKKRGIYVYLDMLDYRMFRTADGVRDGDAFTPNWDGSSKGASIFVERMIELQKDYATKLLTHENPYTGLRYVDDPAIALIETTNENSVFYFLTNRNLSTPYYRELLRKRWNRWLKQKYSTHQAFQKAWMGADGSSELRDDENLEAGTISFPKAELIRFSKGLMPDRTRYLMGPLRMRDALLFLSELQADYYDQMQRHFKEVIGVRVPISGTNQVFTVADTWINSQRNDFTCGNQYWFHPSVRAKPFPKFANIARVKSDFPSLRGPMTVLARNTAAGKPHVVTEFNYPWPNEYRCEGTLLTTAYACLQDWDGLLFFVYRPDGKMLQFFDSQSDPARWGFYPAAVTMFHRHDVAAARNEIHVAHTPRARTILQPDERSAPYTTFRYLTFLSKVRNVFPDGIYRGTADAVLAAAPSHDLPVQERTPVIRFDTPPWKEWQYARFVRAAKKLGLPGYEEMEHLDRRLTSDTGQLSLDYKQGLMRIDTPSTQAAIGYLRDAGPVSLGAVRIRKCRTEFATVSVTSLDGKPIGQSRRLLVTAVGRVEHTHQGFWPQPINPKSWSPYTTWMLPAVGRLPVIVQPIDAVVTVRVSSESCQVYALDPTGKRASPLEESLVRQENGAIVLYLNPRKGKSIWFEVVCP